MNNQYRQIKCKQLSNKRSISVSRETNSIISSIKKTKFDLKIEIIIKIIKKYFVLFQKKIVSFSFII